MTAAFYLPAAIAAISTLLVITSLSAIHALLYLIVSLLSVAVIFFTLGAPFIAALEVIIYAGAIMVLFVFVVMMLNLGPASVEQERSWMRPRTWIGPSVLVAALAVELVYLLVQGGPPGAERTAFEPREVGIALFGPYLLGVELVSFLLLGGLIGAYHLGRHARP